MANNADNNWIARFVQNQLASIVVFIFLAGQLYNGITTLTSNVATIEDVQKEYREVIHTLEINQKVLQDDLEEIQDDLKEIQEDNQKLHRYFYDN